MHKRFRLTDLFISHDLNLVRHISTRVAVMYLGRIVELADKRPLYGYPFHPYREALISAAPSSNPLREKTRIFLKGDIPSPVNVLSGCRFHTCRKYRREECIRMDPTLSEIEAGRWVTCLFSRR